MSPKVRKTPKNPNKMKTSNSNPLWSLPLVAALAILCSLHFSRPVQAHQAKVEVGKKLADSPSAVIMSGIGPFCNRMVVAGLRKK